MPEEYRISVRQVSVSGAHFTMLSQGERDIATLWDGITHEEVMTILNALNGKPTEKIPLIVNDAEELKKLFRECAKEAFGIFLNEPLYSHIRPGDSEAWKNFAIGTSDINKKPIGIEEL